MLLGSLKKSLVNRSVIGRLTLLHTSQPARQGAGDARPTRQGRDLT